MADTNQQAEIDDPSQMMPDDARQPTGTQADKENISASIANQGSQELLDMVEKQGIVVTDKSKNEQQPPQNGQEAYFALLANDLANIAMTFQKDIHEVHKIFYEVSCDRDKLISFLNRDPTVKRWEPL